MSSVSKTAPEISECSDKVIFVRIGHHVPDSGLQRIFGASLSLSLSLSTTHQTEKIQWIPTRRPHVYCQMDNVEENSVLLKHILGPPITPSTDHLSQCHNRLLAKFCKCILRWRGEGHLITAGSVSNLKLQRLTNQSLVINKTGLNICMY